MKKVLLLVLFATGFPESLFAQGQVVFANRVGSDVDAPVFYATTLSGPGPAFTAQLWSANADNSLTPLTPTTVFRQAGTGAAAIADRYWVNQTVDVPGVMPGLPGTFVVRVWRTSLGSFDEAKAAGPDWGESAPFTVTVGGGILPPSNLSTLQSFYFPAIPEPVTGSLLWFGLLAFVTLDQFRRGSNGL